VTRFAAALLDPALLRPLFWALLTLALFFALDPRPPVLPIDRFGDKFEHMLAFAALTLVADLAWPRAPAWRIALLLSLFGAGIEVLQAIPALHRDADWRDWVADSGAIALATLAARGVLIRFAPRAPLP
jgi:hypothetical protein